MESYAEKADHDMTPYGEFQEAGYTFCAFMPRDSDQQPEWRIEVTTEAGELVRSVAVPMQVEPRYGADIDDVAALEAATGKLLEEFSGSS